MDDNLLQNIAIELKAHAVFSESGESVNTEYALEAAKAIANLIEKTGYKVVKADEFASMKAEIASLEAKVLDRQSTVDFFSDFIRGNDLAEDLIEWSNFKVKKGGRSG